MEYKQKEQIIKSGDEVIKNTESETNSLVILRSYNKWYTEALEFVQSHAKSRLSEFEVLHTKNQSLLCQKPPDLQLVRINLTIQLAIIEGSSDHTIRIKSSISHPG